MFNYYINFNIMENEFDERIQHVLEIAQALFGKKECRIQMKAIHYGGKSIRKVDLRQLNKHLLTNGNYLPDH